MDSASQENPTLDTSERDAATVLAPLDPTSPPADGPALSRRQFLGSSLGTAAALTGAAVALPGIAGTNTARADPGGGTPTPDERKEQALRVRHEAAYDNFIIPVVPHPVNGDEVYPWFASYTKGLRHNQFGEVEGGYFERLLEAIAERTLGAFDEVPIGTSIDTFMKFVNPMGGVAFDLEGIDSHEFTMDPPPRFSSAEEAGEIVENYWMALLRDVPFTEYRNPNNALVQRALDGLNALSDFKGPKINGQVTPRTLFRENLPGTLVGPLISQFFYRSQPFGAQYIQPRMRTVLPERDFMTDESTWLDVQNGIDPSVSGIELEYDNEAARYIRNGRDMGEWVHIDVLYQAYFQAALHMLTPRDPGNPFTGGGLGLEFNVGNPYPTDKQVGFGTFGGPYIMTILTEVATRALKAAWYQKWFVHRRLRPEAFAGRVHHYFFHSRPYELHDDVLNASVLEHLRVANDSFFLPMAFPEGSPMHPAYAAGHGTVAGACVTMLKALFKTDVQLSQLGVFPVVPTDDGLNLVPYNDPGVDPQMTVEGELNKLAHNVAYGRNMAGVHWRSDGLQSLLLGEEVAISVLRDQRGTYCEDFNGFTFRRFNGTLFTV